MFGYVLPDRALLTDEEIQQYRSVYCALCHALKELGFGAKLLLNYDFVFAAMLHMSVSGEPPTLLERRCNTNPLRKQSVVARNPALCYAAAALIISSWHKLRDDMTDESLWKRIAACVYRAGITGAYKRAKQRYPELDPHIEQLMREQQLAEQTNNSSIDRACEPTSAGLGAICAGMADQPKTRRILYKLGYALGRFVYLADACDDMREDVKRRRYNVFAIIFGLHPNDDSTKARAEALAQMRLTSAQISLCYRLLEPKYYTSVLDNIIYDGLLMTANRVAADNGKGKHHARPL